MGRESRYVPGEIHEFIGNIFFHYDFSFCNYVCCNVLVYITIKIIHKGSSRSSTTVAALVVLIMVTVTIMIEIIILRSTFKPFYKRMFASMSFCYKRESSCVC